MQNIEQFYESFTDYMIDYLTKHQEYQSVIVEAAKDDETHLELVQDLWDIWIRDPDRIGEYFDTWIKRHDN